MNEASNRLVNVEITKSVVSKLNACRTDFDYFINWKFRVSSLHTSTRSLKVLHKSYNLLKPNNIIDHTQALFILLGLDALVLEENPVWECFDMHTVNPRLNTLDCHTKILYKTPQNQALKNSDFVENGKITSKDLIKLADNHNFFNKEYLAALIKKPKTGLKTTENRNLSEDFAKKLHQILTNYGLISGDFDDMWTWEKAQNALAYLSDNLSLAFPEQCPRTRKEVILLAYIINPGKSRLSQVKESTDRPTLRSIDSAISSLKGNHSQ